MFHIPNGGSRNVVEAVHFKQQGVKPGVPDIFLPIPTKKYHGLFIELKKDKGGRVSPEQHEWIDYLTKQGYKAQVCKGFDEAQKTIERYLKGE